MLKDLIVPACQANLLSLHLLCCDTVACCQAVEMCCCVRTCSGYRHTVTQLKLGKLQAGCFENIAVQIMLHDKAPLYPDLGVQ